METATKSAYTNDQIIAWLRGLLAIAWADGHFDPEEKELIAQFTHNELATDGDIETLTPITPPELAVALGKDKTTAENFLRTGVLVAVADGVYSEPEAELLHAFSHALGLKLEALHSLEHTLYKPEATKAEESVSPGETETIPHPLAASKTELHPNLLQPVRHWLDGMEVHEPRVAKFICKMVPSQCPFERDIKLFGHKIVHIPPMCKLNPLYEQLVALRFRALSYLADDCGEDVSQYI